jgi:hypothetical protein
MILEAIELFFSSIPNLSRRVVFWLSCSVTEQMGIQAVRDAEKNRLSDISDHGGFLHFASCRTTHAILRKFGIYSIQAKLNQRTAHYYTDI